LFGVVYRFFCFVLMKEARYFFLCVGLCSLKRLTSLKIARIIEIFIQILIIHCMMISDKTEKVVESGCGMVLHRNEILVGKQADLFSLCAL
jgi:hypothetical protein